MSRLPNIGPVEAHKYTAEERLYDRTCSLTGLYTACPEPLSLFSE